MYQKFPLTRLAVFIVCIGIAFVATNSVPGDGAMSVPSHAQAPLLRLTIIEHSDAVHCVAFSPDGKTLASASKDTTVKLWNVASGKCESTFEVHAPVYAVAYSPDGKALAWAGMDGCITVRDLATGKQTFTPHDNNQPINVLAISADGKHLASGSKGKSFILWKLDGVNLTEQFRHEFAKATTNIQNLAFSPDSKLLTVAPTSNSGVTLWDVASGKLAKTLTDNNATDAVAFSPDGKTIATGGKIAAISIWNIASGELIDKIHTSGSNYGVSSLAYSPDGKMLAAGIRLFGKPGPKTKPPGPVNLFNVELRTLMAHRDGHTSPATSVAISPDGKTLASASLDFTIRLWTMPDPPSLTLASPDRR